jgi:hypothetical protein
MIHKYVNINKLNVQKLPLDKFKHIRDWDIWGDREDSKKRWTINDVLKNPDKYKRDYKNILKSDLKYPIITIYTPLDTYFIMDGHHRYAKSIMEKRKTIDAYVFTDPKLMKKFRLGKQTRTIWDKIDKMTKKDFDALYAKKFG